MCDKKIGTGFEQRIESELLKILAEDSVDKESIIDELVENYRILVALLTKKHQPKNIKLDPDDLGNIVINDVSYDMNMIFSHSNKRATECRCAIDSLISDLGGDTSSVLQKVKNILNQE